MCVAIIEEENVVVGLALEAHDGGADLTEADSMAPATADQDEVVLVLDDVEGGGEEMALAEGTADLELLADGERLLRANDLQTPDAAALATVEGDDILDLAEVDVQLAGDELGEGLTGVGHRPTVEVGGLLVVVVEHLREDLLVVGIAVGVVERDEVGLGRVFPAVLELFGLAATAFVEAGIADLSVVGEHLSAGLGDGLCHMGVAGLGDALIALAVVVGTDVEDGMVFAVVPADDLIIFLDEGEEAVVAVLVTLALLHLCQEPGTGDDGVGLEELDGGGGGHLAGDDAGEITFDGQLVDGYDLIGLDHDMEGAFELFGLLALPVEVDADGDVVEAERGLGLLGGESEVAVLGAAPHDATLVERYRLGAGDGLALGKIGAVELEGDLLGGDDADGDGGLFRALKLEV